MTFKILLRHNLRMLVLESKFYVVAFLLTGLAATTTWLRSSDYRAAQGQERAESARNELEIEQTGELNRLYDMAPPQVEADALTVFHQGVPLSERKAGTTESDVSEAAFNANPLQQVFPPFDFANVVVLVLGLMVLLTSSLALTDEREAGTFEVLLTYGVSPRALVLAKWLANGLASGMLLGGGMAVALIVAASSGVRLRLTSIGDFVLSASTSALFLLCLSAMGTMLSAHSRFRTRSIISAIGLWMLLAIVLPSSGAYLAASIAPLKDLGEKKRTIDRILTDDREASLNSRISGLYAKDNPSLDRLLHPAGLSAEKFRALPDSDADRLARQLGAQSPAFASFIAREQSDVIDIIQSTWHEHADRAEKVESQLQSSINAQNRLILMFTAGLPATAYRESLSRVFGISYRDLLHAREAQKAYKREAVDYIFAKARSIGGLDPFNQHADLTDRPHFTFVPRDAAERWRAAAPFILVLAAWTALALLAAVKFASSRS
jgi:ABC-type transport system involved in multi-copper enzyme maturation permease subunit